jgi:hypothetical protein
MERTWMRRTAGAIVILVGAVFIGSVIVNNLFSVGPAFERMSDGFRPAMQSGPIAQFRSDLQGFGAVNGEFNGPAGQQLAGALNMTPEEFQAFMAQQYPDVAKGMQQLPAIVQQFQGVVNTLAAEQGRFAKADAIPTSNLPATTIPWAMLVAGIVLVGLGIWIVVRPIRAVAVVAIALGAALVIAPLLMNLPSKAQAADTMNDHLKPVYTAQLIASGKAALATVGAMGQQMQTKMLPDLGAQLNMSPGELQAFLQQNLPATAGALQAMPDAMARFQSVIGTFDQHLSDYRTLTPVAFVPIVWTIVVGGIVVVIAGTWALLAERRREDLAESPPVGLPRAA